MIHHIEKWCWQEALGLLGFSLSGASFQALRKRWEDLNLILLNRFLVPPPAPYCFNFLFVFSLSLASFSFFLFTQLACWLACLPVCLSACVLVNSLHGCNDPNVIWQGQA